MVGSISRVKEGGSKREGRVLGTGRGLAAMARYSG